MGIIWGDLEEYVQADKTLQKGIKFYEDAYKEEDLQTIATMDRVALVCKEQGNWVSAESLLTRAMRTRRKIQGPNHQDTLSSRVRNKQAIGRLITELGVSRTRT